MDNLITLTMNEIERYRTAKRLINKGITEEEARCLMGLKSVRQVRRIKKRILEEGAKGIKHRSRGKPGNRKLDETLVKECMTKIREKYSDFKPTFAAEKLLDNHNLKIGREKLRQLMTKEGLWKPKNRRMAKNHRMWRERKENYGQMQQFDGSYHKWLEDRYDGELCLLLSVDDATGNITKAKFDFNEGVIPVFNFWWEYAEEHGLPVSIYLDKFSTYKINHPCAVDNKDLKTQFQRATQELDIKLITANSPEAKGRVERMNGTLQDRLIKEMRLANICTMEAANEFLKTFIPKFNAKFSVVPKGRANLHRKVDKGLEKKFPQIFSVKNQRKVNNDYTIMFKTQFFQLLEKQPTTVFKKDTVTVEERLNGDIKIKLKGTYLDFTSLPKRPKKNVCIPVAALTNRSSDYKPPVNHPWRMMGVYAIEQRKLRSNKKEEESKVRSS